MGSEFQNGVEALKVDAARADAGRDRADATASDFDAGYEAGRATRDPNNTAAAGETGERVRNDCQGKNEEERRAYKDGYARGAENNKE